MDEGGLNLNTLKLMLFGIAFIILGVTIVVLYIRERRYS